MNKQIFISSSYYKQKYYANPQFEGLPIEIRNDMRDLCIMLAEKLHGIITLGFHLSGDVFLEIEAEEGDFEYDEIGSRLELKEIEEENKEMFKTMKLWYLMYKTEYGDVFRKTLNLYHNEKKTSNEIIDTLCHQYGNHMKDIIVEIIETIQE